MEDDLDRFVVAEVVERNRYWWDYGRCDHICVFVVGCAVEWRGKCDVCVDVLRKHLAVSVAAANEGQNGLLKIGSILHHRKRRVAARQDVPVVFIHVYHGDIHRIE